MPMHPLVGHHEARRRVARAAAQGRLPQVMLVEGPQGVGKQRFALWVAQLLLCQDPGEEPCGLCPPCGRVLGLTHPDLHWMVPIPRPKGSPDKAVEEAAEAIAQVMADRRANPLYNLPDGMAGHGVASARLLLRHSSMTPVEGRWKVFLIGEAERLVVQEASPEAANALLKLLEEPPADSTFLLTSAEPDRLLPTLRSRAVPLRLGRLRDEDVGSFLQQGREPALDQATLKDLVARADGSIGRTLVEGDDAAKARRAALALLESVGAGPLPAMESALSQGPWAARGDFSAMLDALAEILREAARVQLGHPGGRPLPPVLRQSRPERLVGALERVAAAKEAAQGNVNPQLLVSVLGQELAEAL